MKSELGCILCCIRNVTNNIRKFTNPNSVMYKLASLLLMKESPKQPSILDIFFNICDDKLSYVHVLLK